MRGGKTSEIERVEKGCVSIMFSLYIEVCIPPCINDNYWYWSLSKILIEFIYIWVCSPMCNQPAVFSGHTKHQQIAEEIGRKSSPAPPLARRLIRKSFNIDDGKWIVVQEFIKFNVPYWCTIDWLDIPLIDGPTSFPEIPPIFDSFSIWFGIQISSQAIPTIDPDYWERKR